MREPGSAAVQTLLASSTPAISRLSQVEVASALARRARVGDIGVRDRDLALAALDADLGSFLIVEITAPVTSRARALLNAHVLRAADATQLASCQHLQEKLGQDVPFVVYDERLAAVARRAAMTVLDSPDTEPTDDAAPIGESTP